jgi:hypothetical protein
LPGVVAKKFCSIFCVVVVVVVIIIIIIIIIIVVVVVVVVVVVSSQRAFLPGTSLEPAVIPTA